MTDTVTIKQKGQINVVLKQKTTQNKDAFFKNEEDRANHFPLEQIENKMNRLVGMSEIKRTVKEIYAWLYVNQKRKQHHLKVQSQALHMLFKGNPGTGKTTVARLLGELFLGMNVLSKGHLIEADRGDLVGEYIGQTAQKTRDLVKKALGGILFIDEAYSLARGGEKDFGKEAVDTLVKMMEDYQHDFVLILAGYSNEMSRFLNLNPGLPSRFPIIISFPNYSDNELMLISEQMLTDRDYRLTDEARKKLKNHLLTKSQSQPTTFSNGRYVRNIIEKAIRQQAIRLLREGQYDKDSLLTLRAIDFNIEDSQEQQRNPFSGGISH